MILVTGASGFIGNNLVRKISQKHKVRALVRKQSNISRIQNKNIEICYGDVQDYDSVIKATKDIREVIHLAAITKGKLKEINKIIGEDTVLTLQTLLIEKYGSNVRNNISHGLEDFHGYEIIPHMYTWWITLRMLIYSKIAYLTLTS